MAAAPESESSLAFPARALVVIPASVTRSLR